MVTDTDIRFQCKDIRHPMRPEYIRCELLSTFLVSRKDMDPI